MKGGHIGIKFLFGSTPFFSLFFPKFFSCCGLYCLSTVTSDILEAQELKP